MQICEFDSAEKTLKTAHKLEPNDKLVNESLIELNQLQAKCVQLEKATYKRMFRNPPSHMEVGEYKPLRSQESPACSPEFKKLAQEQIHSFLKNKDLLEMSMPDCNLTVKEIHCILEEAQKADLAVREVGTVSNFIYLFENSGF